MSYIKNPPKTDCFSLFHEDDDAKSPQRVDLGSFRPWFFQVNMATSARRRLLRDFKRLQEDPPEGVSGAPGENNIMVWNAVIFGPHETPFEDGTFKLMVRQFS